MHVEAQEDVSFTPPLHLAQRGQAAIAIDADFPGGNIVVDSIDGDVVRLHQELRDTAGWWFYWALRVRGAEGRTLEFAFTDGNPIGTRGPAVSLDEGVTWAYLGADAVTGASFTYAFPPDVRAVRFAFGLPYQEADFAKFLAQHEGSPHLDVRGLCLSRQGRQVERLHIGCIGSEPQYRVLLTARHHSCESVASYVLEGLLAATLADTDLGGWFRKHVEILAIPFVDKDGVEDGDQGKNRAPRDHNRDYDGVSLYPETAALRAFVPAWSQGRLAAAIDLHCPHIRGALNEKVYLVGLENPRLWEEQNAFGMTLEDLPTLPVPYHAADNLPFGEAWNTAKNYDVGMGCARWAGGLDGVRMATTIEFPYANVGEITVTPERARAFGAALAEALRRYLEGGE
jgi:hypothetical protein